MQKSVYNPANRSKPLDVQVKDAFLWGGNDSNDK